MHRHDADRIAALLVEGSRRLLARQEAIVGKRHLTRCIAQFRLGLRDRVDGLEDVRRLCATLRPALGETGHPAGLVDHVAHDRSKRILPQAREGAAQDRAGAGEQRKVAEARGVVVKQDAELDIATAGLAGLRVPRRCQRKEFLDTQREQRGGEHRGQALCGVGEIAEHMHERADGLGLLRGGEHRTAADHAVEALCANGIRIDARAGHAAQQQNHVACGLIGIGEGAKPLGDGLGLGRRALLGSAARDKQGLTTRGARDPQAVGARVVREQVEEAGHDAALSVVEDACDILEHLGVAAEVLDELDHGPLGTRSGPLLDAALGAAKHLDFGAAEAIDGLLGIAHGAQRATALARQEVDEVDLLLVGVLELVDHDHREFARIRIADAGVIAQRLIGEAEQVVVIECRAFRLERGILVADGASKGEQLVEGGASESQIGVDEGVGGLSLEQSHLLLGRGMPQASMHAARSPRVCGPHP